ncbi:hypothetical protein V1264_004211 [Littorina saxatilis]|uniref:Alpha-amylase n=1 Tax=Littorina saxatilis TaxID=31220 RepID=A0AAN9B1L0_9CAEN
MLALWLSTLVCLGLKAAALPSSPPGGRHDDYLDPHCGGRQVIVQLFDWRWIDVAAECERCLGRNEFCGVQVSPPNEHALVDSPPAPWWQRYQAVSYKLHSDSGTEAEFISMVNNCKAAGVRIYVDAVFNNMAEVGRFGKGSAGSTYDSDFREFPAVPYGLDDFHDASSCPSKNTFVNDYNNPGEVRNCSYIGRTDVDQSKEHVREKVSEYLNRLIQLGVAGFRIDLAKFMWPRDLQAIQERLTDLPEGGRPFIYHHVENYGDDVIKTSEYTDLGYVTEFRYGQFLARAMTKGLDNLLGIQGQGQEFYSACLL